MSSLSQPFRRLNLRRKGRMLLHESLESRSLLSAVPVSELAEQWVEDHGHLLSNPSIVQRAASFRSVPRLNIPSLQEAQVRIQPALDTLDLNSILFNYGTDSQVDAARNGLGVVNSHYDTFDNPPLTGLSIVDAVDNFYSQVIAVPVSGTDFVFLNSGTATANNLLPSYVPNADQGDFPSGSVVSEPQNSLVPRNATDPTGASRDSLSEVAPPSTDSPAFALTEPRLQEFPATIDGVLSNPASMADEPPADRAFDHSTSTVDIAGMLSQHATPRGPKALGIGNAPTVTMGVALGAITSTPRSISQATSVVDSPHQGRLRIVEIATDDPWFVQDPNPHAIRPVALHDSEPSRPVPMRGTPARILPVRTLESTPEKTEIRENSHPVAGSTTALDHGNRKSQRISWDRYLHSIVGRWSRYLEMAFSTALATGMIILFQLKVREKDRDHQTAQFRRWYTAAFMDKNRTIAAPNTSEK